MTSFLGQGIVMYFDSFRIPRKLKFYINIRDLCISISSVSVLASCCSS